MATSNIILETTQQGHTLLHINEDQEKVCVSKGTKVMVHSGTAIKNCYVFGGEVEVQAGGTVQHCIVNSGSLSIFTGAKVGAVTAKTGSSVTVRTGVRLTNFRQTGPVMMSIYPGAEVKAPLKNKDAHA